MNEIQSADELSAAIEASLIALDGVGFAGRLWEKDSSIWKEDAEHRKVISNRLGWMDSVEFCRSRVSELTAFADQVKGEFRHVLLLGMGGSSLCPDVFARTFGSAAGYPALRVLDSTDPAAVAAAESAVDLEKTLFIVASKSGGTAEVDAFYRYFRSKVDDGSHFIAITDPGSPLEKRAGEEGFRRVFLNPADIGGRYSALSYFGLVPAALIGLDINLFLERADEMVRACGPSGLCVDNPGIWLGTVLAEATRSGRDKMTIISSPEVRAFGAWIEQLVAESTGKENEGIIPVDLEETRAPGSYGSDRCFVYIRLEGSTDTELDNRVQALEESGMPTILITIDNLLGLGEEFYRWEMATAVAAAILNVNAFDEPNVTESKRLTGEALRYFEENGDFPEDPCLVEENGIRLYGDDGLETCADTVELLRAHFDRGRDGDYVALLAYLPAEGEIPGALQQLRNMLGRKTGAATTLGFGPRFLHSTGQLHKGGPNSGLFIQFTCDDPADLPIPGLGYSFGILKRAQALGDMQALKAHERRVVRCHIGGDVVAGLKRIEKLLH